MAGYNYLDVNPKLDKWITDTETGALIGVRQCQEKTLTVWNISNSTPGVFTSSQLATALTDETGSGAAVFATSPTLVTPTLGVATATSMQGIVGNVTPAAGTFTALTSTTSTTLASESVALTANNLPTVRPTLLLDFANSKSVDPRITFTRASTATRINDKGLIETVASGAPRIDYDPVTLAPKGLLVEEARTNLLTYSEQFDNAAWLKNGLTVSSNATVAPDGTFTADKLVEASSSQYNYIYRNRTASNETVTASAYVKEAGRKYFEIQFTDTVAYVANAVFDLNSGVIFSTSSPNAEYSGITSSIQGVGSGWYRVSLTATKASINPDNVLSCFIVSDNGVTVLYTGDGTSGLYIWGAQLEAGAFPTSYIPTTSAQVTRAADVATMTGTNFSSWYRQDEFSAVAKFIANAVGTQVYAKWNDATANEEIKLESVSGTLTLTVTDGGVTQASLALGSVTTGTTYTVAAAWKLNDIAASINGGAVVTDTAATLPTPTQRVLGSSVNAREFPIRLANATLQALSTP